jgi:uncharacterized protein (DUF302 family)
VRDVATFGIKRTLDVGFDEALARIPGALKAEGFGVLTEIDVQQTLKSKLGVDFRRYRILGACNPPFAHKALEHSLDIGMLLPCNVIVYETDDGHTVVSAIDPMQTLAAQGDESLRPIAEEVRRRLRKVVDGL